MNFCQHDGTLFNYAKCDLRQVPRSQASESMEKQTMAQWVSSVLRPAAFSMGIHDQTVISMDWSNYPLEMTNIAMV